MHHIAEYGIASHITYKEPATSKISTSTLINLIPSLFRPFTKSQTTSISTKTKEILPKDKIPLWISEIGKTYTKEKNPTSDFIEDIKDDFFSNRIFVFTPNGDVVDLPAGATPIDFAYAIHSDIGDHTFGARINKKLISLDTELKNGDIVEIETKRSAKPSQKWLDFVRTSLAKRRIKNTLENAQK